MPLAPRFGDAPRRGPPASSAEEVARLTRRTAIASGLLVVWALAGVIVAIGPAASVAWGAVPLGLLALVLLFVDLRRPSAVLSAIAAGSATIALALAVAGHALYWGGFNLRLVLVPVSGTLKWTVFASVLLLVPLYAGVRTRALRLAWAAAGSRARGPGAHLQALLPARGLAARWAEGAALPGTLVLDAALRARPAADRMHAEANVDALAAALSDQGASVERKGRDLVVRMGGEPVVLSRSRMLIPPGPTLDLRGRRDDARKIRRALEADASHALTFTWSAVAQRWEARLNALRVGARAASSLEERSIVMEELDRVRRAIDERSLCGEEWTILAMKERDTRALLAHKMLSEPPGSRSERVLAQHAALMPDVGQVLDAGGLAAVKRIAFVPHWIVPVETSWGQQEAVVSAATGKFDAEESRALLDIMRGRGPWLFLDVGTQAIFLPAPPPTGALLREMRSAGLVVSEDVATGELAADVVYVPYVATADGYKSGVTGRVAADLGSVAPVAPG